MELFECSGHKLPRSITGSGHQLVMEDALFSPTTGKYNFRFQDVSENGTRYWLALSREDLWDITKFVTGENPIT